MISIRWTRSARADLRAIYDYIARDSKQYAQRTMDRIKAAVERLRQFPKSGARVLECLEWEEDELRELLTGNYRVVYRQRPSEIQILAVIHAARELPGSLRTGP